MLTNTEKGKLAEDLASRFLEGKGYKILSRNFYTQMGEIDIVCEDNGQLVFCEVKSKFNQDFGLPEEEFDYKKYVKFNRAVMEYIRLNEVNHDNYRVDLLALQMDPKTKTCRIKHYKAYY